MSTENPFDLTPTTDLIDELYRRSGDRGSVLVVICRDHSDSAELTSVHFRGGRMAAIGMAIHAGDWIRSDEGAGVKDTGLESDA